MNKYRICKSYIPEGGPAQDDVLEEYAGHDYDLLRYEEMCRGEPCVALASGKESPIFYVFPLSYVERI